MLLCVGRKFAYVCDAQQKENENRSQAPVALET